MTEVEDGGTRTVEVVGVPKVGYPPNEMLPSVGAQKEEACIVTCWSWLSSRSSGGRLLGAMMVEMMKMMMVHI